ncbi:hypothetical protein T265_11405 [Opisthorchis viverrini]|uniref:Uncharacterized protein n=1 Tax=Opisthorchis viverrini TaxID=6198 RepID=A0A074Z336_OPIVI|nr:hypothetical protein T265_11405 [Opisthorchis viverrini]KER19937.1 hypothetical protein T265_11405 [Opisthorchis viverrini]
MSGVRIPSPPTGHRVSKVAPHRQKAPTLVSPSPECIICSEGVPAQRTMRFWCRMKLFTGEYEPAVGTVLITVARVPALQTQVLELSSITIGDKQSFVFIKETTHKVAENSWTARDRFRPFWSSSGRRIL